MNEYKKEILKYAEMSDEELLAKAANRDDLAFAFFCERVLPRLVRVQKVRCTRYNIPIHLAEDIVNESLLKAVRWHQDHPRSELSANWLFTVARNLSKDWLRHRRVERRAEGDAVNQLVDKDRDERKTKEILEYFDKMKYYDREILTRIIVNGQSVADAAKELNIEEWTAYKRYERALKKLRMKIREDII